ncbi:RDD family protein [Streptomyces sp. NPDC050428]|uniref:RDD family protein n=1 Tax=Streptomyces sp. NPDC050428 TaxID=3155757 RepID=UPI0034176A4A
MTGEEDDPNRAAQEDLEKWTDHELRARQRTLAATMRSRAGTPALPGHRLLAFLVDIVTWTAAMLLPSGLNAVIVELLGADSDGPATVPGIVISLVVFLFYVPISTHLWGATPGKLALRLRVINYHLGAPVSPSRSWGRFLVHALFVPLCWGIVFLVDHLWILREEGRALHDKVSGTTVVRVPEAQRPI